VLWSSISLLKSDATVQLFKALAAKADYALYDNDHADTIQRIFIQSSLLTMLSAHLTSGSIILKLIIRATARYVI